MPTIKDLRGKAKNLGLANYSKLNKANLTHTINMAMVEAGKMPTLDHLRGLAEDLRIESITGLKQAELIHAIQVAEGNVACFGRIPDCTQADCLFKPKCLA